MLFFKSKEVIRISSISLANRFWGIFLLAIGLISCNTSTDPLPSDHWQEAGLEKMSVSKLNLFKKNIYAATGEGLYRKEITDTSWTSLGLRQKEVLDVVFLPGEKLLVAVHVSSFSGGGPSLFLSSDNGQSWQPYMNDYGGNTDVTKIVELEATSKPSDTLYAGTGVLLARSFNAGKNWQLLGERWDLWGGQLNFLATDPYHERHLWFGGHDAFFLPFLARSTDNGNSWKNIDVGNTAWDIWVFPNNPDNILITTDGGIRRSTDGGENWQQVFSEAGIRTFVHSARNPEVVYASGESPNGTLFFAASRNFGDSWKTILWEEGPTGVTVNDMVSVMENGNEVLYFGTNKGVYSYRFEE